MILGSSLSSLQELHMLLRVGLLNIALSNLLHHKVGIDVNLLAELAIRNAPLAGDSKDADGRLSVDEGVDALGDVGEGELVSGLRYISMVVWGRREVAGMGSRTWPIGFLSVTV
jgi:hypothetical protein